MTRQRVSATMARTSRLKTVVWLLAQRVMKLMGVRPGCPKKHLNSGSRCTRRRARRCSSWRVGRSHPLDALTDDGEARNDSLTIIFIVITLNQELNSVCLRQNNSQDHSSTSMLSGGRIRLRMCCWKAVLPIIGTTLDTCAPGCGLQKFKQHQGPLLYRHKFGHVCRKLLYVRKSSIGLLRSRSSTKCWKVERHLFHRSG